MHAAVFSTGFVDDALRNTVQSVNEPLLQLVSAVFRGRGRYGVICMYNCVSHITQRFDCQPIIKALYKSTYLYLL